MRDDLTNATIASLARRFKDIMPTRRSEIEKIERKQAVALAVLYLGIFFLVWGTAGISWALGVLGSVLVLTGLAMWGAYEREKRVVINRRDVGSRHSTNSDEEKTHPGQSSSGQL